MSIKRQIDTVVRKCQELMFTLHQNDKYTMTATALGLGIGHVVKSKGCVLSHHQVGSRESRSSFSLPASHQT